MKYFLFFSFFIFTSCVDEIKKTIPSMSPSYGISLLLTNDGRPLSAVVFASGPVDGPSPLEMIRSAKVLLWENDSLVDSLTYNERSRHFEGNTRPVAGNKYRCKAYFLDSTILHAQTELPEITPILKWEILPNIGETSFANTYSRLNLTIPVRKDKTCFYELLLRYSRGSDTNSYSSIYETEKACRTLQIADIIDPVLKHEEVIDKILFSTSLMNSDTYDMQVNFFNTIGIESVYIVLRSVSEEYYRFARSVDRYEEGRFPGILENPNAYTIYTNVENGKGVFCGYSALQIGPITGLKFK